MAPATAMKAQPMNPKTKQESPDATAIDVAMDCISPNE
jgi:hypothetical protein